MLALEHKGALGETCELGIVSTLWEKPGFGRLPVFLPWKRRKPFFLLQHPVSEATAKMPSANSATGNAEGSSPRVALACRGTRWSKTRQGGQRASPAPTDALDGGQGCLYACHCWQGLAMPSHLHCTWATGWPVGTTQERTWCAQSLTCFHLMPSR